MSEMRGEKSDPAVPTIGMLGGLGMRGRKPVKEVERFRIGGLRRSRLEEWGREDISDVKV